MTVVIISGANRGLGLGLAQAYAQRPDYTVIAAVRTPSSMPEIKTASGSKVITIKIDAGVTEDALKGIEELKAQGITTIDIGIANAAILLEPNPLSKASLSDFEDMWRVNVLGALAFFQAVFPLMPKGGKFVWMSSGASIIDRVPDKTDAGYGITKSANNYLARYTHFENPDHVIFSLSPGWVQTDMGNRAAKNAGMENAPITTEESVAGMVQVIDDATRDKYSGQHARYNGTLSKW